MTAGDTKLVNEINKLVSFTDPDKPSTVPMLPKLISGFEQAYVVMRKNIGE